MADVTQLRPLVAYNQWADERILGGIEGLDPEELVRPRDADALSDRGADRVVRFTDMRGTPREIQLAQAITHVVNHGTAHRAETGLLLERAGRSPGDLDYSYFCYTHA